MDRNQQVKEGVRERKRREMYRRITEAGLKLFSVHGYEETTLDAIAEASGIARRTFFHYFASKDEIILAWQKALPDELGAEIRRQGAKDSPLATIYAALTALAEHMHPDVAMLIGKIIQSTEQLKMGNQAKFLQMESAACEALCELWPGTDRRAGLRVVAMVSVGAMRLAVSSWVADDCQRPLAEYLAANFKTLGEETGPDHANILFRDASLLE